MGSAALSPGRLRQMIASIALYPDDLRSATTSFNACASRRRSFTSSEVAARVVSPASRFLKLHAETQRIAMNNKVTDGLAQFALSNFGVMGRSHGQNGSTRHPKSFKSAKITHEPLASGK